VSMEVLAELVELTEAELDTQIRATELQRRSLIARQAMLIAVATARQVPAADGHRSMAGYLRATCNWSSGEVTQMRKLARLINDVPGVGEALVAGYIGVAQALEIGRVHAHRRIGHLTAAIAPTLLEQAEHLPFADFKLCVDRFIMLADLDGGFDDVAANVEHRTALVTEVGGAVHVQANGGDPLVAAGMIGIFERFVQAEFRKDVEARRAEFGDEADQHPLPRSGVQRSFDALQTIFDLAATAADRGAVPTGSFDALVNIVCDDRTVDGLMASGGLTLPNGRQLDVDEFGSLSLDAIVDRFTDDPASLLDRRCETIGGTPLHPRLVLQALLTGHVRRVVVDSTGVVTELGRRRRLFTGSAREAAKLLIRTCSHPGCTVRSTFAEVDHVDEWSNDRGATSQWNSDIECGDHNRFKHRHRWRTRRDQHGRTYSMRRDGTIVLPVGEREPDLTADELARIARSRLAALRPVELR
jgi:Domain of unknown function (DUF222)